MKDDCALPKLTDEKIGELWHQSGGHVHKFAKLLREWLANACRGT